LSIEAHLQNKPGNEIFSMVVLLEHLALFFKSGLGHHFFMFWWLFVDAAPENTTEPITLQSRRHACNQTSIIAMNGP
jgi:hypothetical protein